VRLVWKNLPLEQHEHAKSAAAVALHVFDSRGTSEFWKVHDQLFKQAPDLDETALLAIAKREGLAPEVARELISRAERNSKIAVDVALAEKLGVSGTPTFFVNGRRITGARPLAEFRRLVDEELEAARRLIASGTEPKRVYDVLCGGN
jgi:protein-disulfide isomerase